MLSTDEEYLAPDDTSKKPDMATFKLSDGMTEQRVPERVEKVTTQAQTPSMLRAALEIDSVIIAETGIRGLLKGIFTVLSAFFLCKGLYIIPTIIADKSTHRYMVIPMRLDESILPTPPITNAADGRLIKVSISSNSFFEIFPLSKESAAHIAPTG